MDNVLGLLEVQYAEDGESCSEFILNHFPIETNSVLRLGRNTQECVYSVDHPSVSSVHCILWGIRFDPESIPLCYIKDVSLNGTTVNGEELERDVPYLLGNQDLIELPNGGADEVEYVGDSSANCGFWDVWACASGEEKARAEKEWQRNSQKAAFVRCENHQHFQDPDGERGIDT
ncbi:Meiosis-specific serine/threonine-protein kinase mek1 [Kluyveromyces marxianus]|nr:Meiosis-specific serine/threonine-protein kinase mek1 [Kluyveromyces marxianus]